MPNNVGDLGKIIVAKGFKKLSKVQKLAQSGHTLVSTLVVSCCVCEIPKQSRLLLFMMNSNQHYMTIRLKCAFI